MIDIHTHILFNVDDGSSSIDESIKLIEKERENGVKKIVFTPHYIKTKGFENFYSKEHYIKIIEEIKNKIDFEMDFYLGTEIYFDQDIIEDFKNKEVITINDSNYVLVEFPLNNETNIYEKIHNICVYGYTPIVAHIERYSYLSFEDILRIKNKAIIQVNTSSFLGHYGKRAQKISDKLLNQKVIDIISTDCHDMRFRTPNFIEFKKSLPKKIDHEYLEDILFNNALKIIGVDK